MAILGVHFLHTISMASSLESSSISTSLWPYGVVESKGNLGRGLKGGAGAFSNEETGQSQINEENRKSGHSQMN